MKNKFKFWSAFFVASAFIISAGIAYGTSYEDLVKIYLEKESVEKLVESERIYDVRGEKIDAESLWEEIALEKDPSVVSEKGIRLLNYLVEGNVTEWNQLKGFLGPEGYSRSIVAFNTAIYSISALLELGDPVSSRKAYEIAKDLFDSRQTIGVVYRTSGREAFKEKGKLRELAGAKWIENQGYELWNVNEKDSSPFGIEPVRKIRGYINGSEAVSRKMVFLNSNGQVNSGFGSYAWDWETGKVYRLRDREDPDEGKPDRGNQAAPNPGDDDDDDNGQPGDDDDDDVNGQPGDDDDDDDDNGQPGDDDDDDDDNGQPGDDDDDDDDNGQPGDDDDDDDDNGQPGDDDDDDDDNGQPGDDDDDDDDNGQPGDDDDDDDDNGQPGDDDDDDDDNGGPGNGNGNNGNPGNGGGNNNGSGPGSGNGGSNNGQGGDSSNSGGNGNSGNNGDGGSNSGLGDGTNPGNGSGNNNAGDSPGGNGTNNPGGN